LTIEPAELSFPDSTELDISGVQPLNNSVVDTSGLDSTGALPVDLATDDDYVWFQAPITVKGYKEKAPDTVGFWG